MRALLVGAGGMGRAWGRNLLATEGVELAGWVDVMPGQVEFSQAELEITVPGFTDLEVALDEIQPDFVVDVTIPEAHETVTITSLERGYPVLGEKPLAASMAAANRMVKASEDSGKLYMVSQSRRYDGRLTAYQNLVGKLGRLGILDVDFYIGAHFGGFRDAMDHVLILDMAIHTFDTARKLSGLDPVSVYAEEFNPSWSWYQGAASAHCLFEMADGARFNYRGSWCSEGLNSSWEGNWRMVGEHGTALWNGFDHIQAETYAEPWQEGFIREGFKESVESEQVSGGIHGSLLEFMHALQTGHVPQGECHDNIKSLSMVFAAIESSKRGERVSIAEILQS